MICGDNNCLPVYSGGIKSPCICHGSRQIFIELKLTFYLKFSVEKKLYSLGIINMSCKVYSPAFASSGSEVFTINVRLLSVNTSINTAQRCNLLRIILTVPPVERERARERKREDGEIERGVSTSGIVNGWLLCVWRRITLRWISLQQRPTQVTEKHKVSVIEEKLKTW